MFYSIEDAVEGELLIGTDHLLEDVGLAMATKDEVVEHDELALEIALAEVG